jgi:hypothetical protein
VNLAGPVPRGYASAVLPRLVFPLTPALQHCKERSAADSSAAEQPSTSSSPEPSESSPIPATRKRKTPGDPPSPDVSSPGPAPSSPQQAHQQPEEPAASFNEGNSIVRASSRFFAELYRVHFLALEQEPVSILQKMLKYERRFMDLSRLAASGATTIFNRI